MNFRKWWVLGRRLEHFSLFPVHRHKDIRCNVLTTIHGLSYTSRISMAVRMALVSHRTGTHVSTHTAGYTGVPCAAVYEAVGRCLPTTAVAFCGKHTGLVGPMCYDVKTLFTPNPNTKW